MLGIVLLFLGLVFLPAGVYYLFDEFKDYKKLHPHKRPWLYLMEAVDISTGGGSLST